MGVINYTTTGGKLDPNTPQSAGLSFQTTTDNQQQQQLYFYPTLYNTDELSLQKIMDLSKKTETNLKFRLWCFEGYFLPCS